MCGHILAELTSRSIEFHEDLFSRFLGASWIQTDEAILIGALQGCERA
jgi:hypothetical protein